MNLVISDVPDADREIRTVGVPAIESKRYEGKDEYNEPNAESYNLDSSLGDDER